MVAIQPIPKIGDSHPVPSESDREWSDDMQSRGDASTSAFAERVRRNQEKLRSELKLSYDFIVCGSGSSGSVAARRLAENAETSVLPPALSKSDPVVLA
jgi:hypothetical protein